MLYRSKVPDTSSDAALAESRLLTELGFYERADSVLAGSRPPLSWRDRIGYWRARLNFLSGRHDLALRFLGPPVQDLLEIHRLVLQFETLMAMGRLDSSFASAREALAMTPAPPLDIRIRERLLDGYMAADSLERALELAGSLADGRLPPDADIQIRQREIDLLCQTGNTERARRLAQVLAGRYPTEAGTVETILHLLNSYPAEDFEAGQVMTFCRILLEADRLPEARKILAGLTKRRLAGDEMETRTILQADLYYREKKYSQAADLARRRFAKPAYRRDSMLLLARCYRQTGRPLSSASLYTDFAKTFPTDAKAAEALFVAAQLYSRINHPQKSQQILKQLATDYRSSYFGRMAALELAWSFNRRGSYDESVSLLKQLLSLSNWNDEAALYYLAETYARLGRIKEQSETLTRLVELDSTSFYLHPVIESVPVMLLMSSSGSLALDGEDGLIRFLLEVDGRITEAQERILSLLPAGDERASMAAAGPYLERGRCLLEMGFRDLAKDELTEVEAMFRSSPRLLFELACLYDSNGLPWESVRLYQRVWDTVHNRLRRTLAPSFLLLLHPLPFPVQVMENCAREGLDPHLVYAIIREESNFDQTAISRAGAQGLMQLMPGTGRQVARERDLPEELGENLFSPDINLAFGIWYASYLLRRCEGDPLMMLAAYNAGLSNARRWFRTGGDEPVTRIVDSIAYRETRDYVKRIVESAEAYHRLYFNPDRPCSAGKR